MKRLKKRSLEPPRLHPTQSTLNILPMLQWVFIDHTFEQSQMILNLFLNKTIQEVCV